MNPQVTLSPWSNVVWKIATVLAIGASLLSILSNSRSINRLEGQVCDTVYTQRASLPTISYYQDPENADELELALASADATLARFDCPRSEQNEVPFPKEP